MNLKNEKFTCPQIIIWKQGNKLEITNCADVETIDVYSLNKDGSPDCKCENEDYTIVKEEEKLFIILPTNNDDKEYLVKYDKSITKEEFDRFKFPQTVSSLSELIEKHKTVKCSKCGESMLMNVREDNKNKNTLYLFDMCPKCKNETVAFALVRL